MMSVDAGPLLVTHSGKFHCDEVFAYAVLRLALGLSRPGEDHRLLRTRDSRLIATGTIVWDVGLTYDPALERYDHHQIGAPLRPDGTPYSAAGLIWQRYGAGAVGALLGMESSAPLVGAIAAELDNGLLRRIDELDNGVSPHGPVVDDRLGLGNLVGDFNPPWDSPEATGPHAGDAAFLEAADFARGVLARRVAGLRARFEAEASVLAAHASGADPRILVLPRGMPWKNVAFDKNLPIVFCVSPASNGNWMIDTMPPEKNSFSQRVPLPAAWAGLEGDQLAAESGVSDAVFVHVRRFVGAARSQAGALALAQRALEMVEEEADGSAV